jgi:hypothetical protein
MFLFLLNYKSRHLPLKCEYLFGIVVRHITYSLAQRIMGSKLHVVLFASNENCSIVALDICILYK